MRFSKPYPKRPTRPKDSSEPPALTIRRRGRGSTDPDAPIFGESMRGRPPKLTPEVQKEICSYVKRGLTYEDSARLAGVAISTLHLWKKKGRESKRKNKYSDFVDALTRANAVLKAAIHQSMIRASADGDWRAGLQLLTHRFPHEYSEKRILEHSGALAVNSPHEVDYSKLSPEKQAILLALLDEADGGGSGAA